MPEDLREAILKVLNEHDPSSVKELRQILRDLGIPVKETELIELVRKLEWTGMTSLSPPRPPPSFYEYLTEPGVWWIYLVFVVVFWETVLVVSGSEALVASFFRALLGLGVIGFFPGYASQRALFPRGELSWLERLLLSIFLSVTISISLGTILGYFFLFQAGTNIAFLDLFTTATTLVAAYRSFQSESKMTQK